jgi:hypothetical protein
MCYYKTFKKIISKTLCWKLGISDRINLQQQSNRDHVIDKSSSDIALW